MRPDRQLVGSVTKRHEGALELPAVDGAAPIDEPANTEAFDGTWRHDVGPAPFAQTLLKDGVERLVELATDRFWR